MPVRDDSLELVREIADDLPVGVWVALAPGGEFVYANRTFGEIMGIGARADVAAGEYAAPYGIYRTDGEVYPERAMPFVRALEAREVVVVDDIVIHRPDGTKVPVRAHARPVLDANGGVHHVVIVFFDITKEVLAETARDRADARLRHAEKMQSVGQLAGGIAHDFNNVLAAVRIIASRLRFGEQDAARIDLLEQLELASESGARLARQLLLLGGRGGEALAPIEMSELASRVAALLDRTLDGRISVRFEGDDDRTILQGDASRLEQVVMNLAVNARDAMPDGGTLTIRTASRSLDESGAAALPPLRPGVHVVLEVSDTGTGIAPEVRERIFEPYFTTRTSGEDRGTGLGLSTVYGIVEAHRGAIEVLDGSQSAPHGTTMRVWLPAVSVPAPARAVAQGPELEIRGSGTLLFVDDELALRRAAGAALAMLGYDVVIAASGREAVEVVEERGSGIRAVILDLVMPEMDGHATYLALRQRAPELPVILTTGTPFDPAVERLLALGVSELVPKPYGVHELARAIEKAAPRVPA